MHADGEAESLRARRRRELRQQLSDVATRMFLERGFDAVRVADVARACGVTEKTVFNHFPTKESLLVDRWDAQIEDLRTRLADQSVGPVDAALAVLDHELRFLTDGAGFADVRRFGELIRSTPSLVAHNRVALDRLTAAAAAALADRDGTHGDDPAAWITATALAGFWVLYSHGLQRALPTQDAAGVARAVRRDLRAAAGVLRRGLDVPSAQG